MAKGFLNTLLSNKRFLYDVVITTASAALVLYCAATLYPVLFLTAPFLLLRLAYIINRFIPKAKQTASAPYGSFSILICSYNEKSENITLLLNSIQESSVQPQEIIIVDDHSAVPLVIDHPLQDKIKLIRNEQNLRLRGSQVVGIKAAAPVDHLLIIDSDVYFKPDAIERSLQFINDHPDGNIYGVQITIRDFKKDYLNTFINTSYQANYYKRLFESRLGATVTCNGAFMFCKYSFLVNNIDRFGNERFLGQRILTGNDKSLTNLALQNGKSYTIPDVAVTHESFEFKPYVKKIQRAFKTGIIYQVRAIFLKNVPGWVRLFSLLDVLSFFTTVPLQVLFIIALFRLPYFYLYAVLYFIVLAIRNNRSILKILSYALFRYSFTILLYLLRILTLFRLRSIGWGNR